MKQIIISIIISVFLLSCGNNQTKSDQSEYVDSVITEVELDSAKWVIDKINELRQDSLSLVTTNFREETQNNYLSTRIDLLNSCISWSEFVKENQQFFKGNKRASITANIVSSKAKTILNSVSPAYRKYFAKNLAASLWERDIYVTSSGNGNTIINITGGIFAANKNIQDFQNIIQADVNHFGFKQVRYRWYKGADEFTYYNIK
ncbi:MAG: hypothetical protein H6Q18_110 [Bacteroidetes bacterium]|nr:hypothetical protein [Bacteroidota bacterium]